MIIGTYQVVPHICEILVTNQHIYGAGHNRNLRCIVQVEVAVHKGPLALVHSHYSSVFAALEDYHLHMHKELQLTAPWKRREEEEIKDIFSCYFFLIL